MIWMLMLVSLSGPIESVTSNHLNIGQNSIGTVAIAYRCHFTNSESEQSGLSRSESFTLAVGDMNDAPSAMDHTATVHLEATGTTTVPKLWEDDFSSNWEDRWPLKQLNETEAAKATQFTRDGETWLRVTYEEGIVRKGLHFRTEMEHRDSIYMEYKLRFDEDFDWVKGGKLPGLYSGNIDKRQVPDGTDGWSIYFMWRSDGKGSAYVYYPDQARDLADHFRLDNFYFQKGVVQTLSMEVVMNTPGEHDGIIRAWLDGDLVVQETDIRFRDIPQVQIDGILFHTIFGGSTDDWAPPKDEHIEYGDFKIYSGVPGDKHAIASPPAP